GRRVRAGVATQQTMRAGPIPMLTQKRGHHSRADDSQCRALEVKNRARAAIMRPWWLVPLMLLATPRIDAHVNDRGMDYRLYKDRYGQSCCHIEDCRPAADFVETVENGEPAVRLLIDGTWFTVPRSYVVADYASDGRAHFCGKLHRPSRNSA